jgi:hypothetical protein
MPGSSPTRRFSLCRLSVRSCSNCTGGTAA